jgi:hypothetical protein
MKALLIGAVTLVACPFAHAGMEAVFVESMTAEKDGRVMLRCAPEPRP